MGHLQKQRYPLCIMFLIEDLHRHGVTNPPCQFILVQNKVIAESTLAVTGVTQLPLHLGGMAMKPRACR